MALELPGGGGRGRGNHLLLLLMEGRFRHVYTIYTLCLLQFCRSAAHQALLPLPCLMFSELSTLLKPSLQVPSPCMCFGGRVASDVSSSYKGNIRPIRRDPEGPVTRGHGNIRATRRDWNMGWNYDIEYAQMDIEYTYVMCIYIYSLYK